MNFRFRSRGTHRSWFTVSRSVAFYGGRQHLTLPATPATARPTTGWLARGHEQLEFVFRQATGETRSSSEFRRWRSASSRQFERARSGTTQRTGRPRRAKRLLQGSPGTAAFSDCRRGESSRTPHGPKSDTSVYRACAGGARQVLTPNAPKRPDCAAIPARGHDAELPKVQTRAKQRAKARTCDSASGHDSAGRRGPPAVHARGAKTTASTPARDPPPRAPTNADHRSTHQIAKRRKTFSEGAARFRGSLATLRIIFVDGGERTAGVESDDSWRRGCSATSPSTG